MKKELENFVEGNKKNTLKVTKEEMAALGKGKGSAMPPKWKMEETLDPKTEQEEQLPIEPIEEETKKEDLKLDNDKNLMEQLGNLKREGLLVSEEQIEQEENYKINKDKLTKKKKKDISKEAQETIKNEKNYYDILTTDNSIFLLRELPFFKIEPIFVIVSLVMPMFAIFLKLFNAITYDIVIGVCLLSLLIHFSIFMIKRILYLPTKKRKPVIRIFTNGLVKFSCEKFFMGNKIKFSDNVESAVITNSKAHTEFYSGQPLIIALEGYFENLDIISLIYNKLNNRSSSKVISALDESMSLGIKKERLKNINEEKKESKNLLMYIGLGLIIIMLIASVLMYSIPLKENIDTLTEKVNNISVPAAQTNKIYVDSNGLIDLDKSSQVVNIG